MAERLHTALDRFVRLTHKEGEEAANNYLESMAADIKDQLAHALAALEAARFGMRDARRMAQDAQGGRDVDTAVWGDFLDKLASRVGIDVEDLTFWGDRSLEQKRNRVLAQLRPLNRVPAAETLTKELDAARTELHAALQKVAALRARVFPSPTTDEAYVVTCEKCGRKLVTRWITTGPVGGVDVATCPCGYNILSESEGNAESVADLLKGHVG